MYMHDKNDIKQGNSKEIINKNTELFLWGTECASCFYC